MWMNKYVCVCVFVVMNLCVCEVVFSGYVCVWMVVYLCVYMCESRMFLSEESVCRLKGAGTKLLKVKLSHTHPQRKMLLMGVCVCVYVRVCVCMRVCL